MEYNNKQITDAYQRLLGRAPDKGAKYWIDGANEQRFPVEWAVQNILASPEYATKRGGSKGVVTGWYAELLPNRSASTITAGEKAYWVDQIAQIGSLGAVRDFYYSGNPVRARINAHYQVLLERDADGGGLMYWFLKEIESDVNVQVLIASTDEYRALGPNTD